ncbi:MAG: PAS domain S-box protein [candidate division Zixibacteria bacterium]|nr:PAS domain S-box protein [candidate division Zixibacteria bacterium]NIR64123.1 PAS domain S-box protein [candidate division Zixibacteria bacterium]NIS16919.1 PAS domain S-box protein [candidate division Zixibacteria bacterium]NIS46023.1 PAS domain S-box protein [candidate division Zixibacteria bacterium]NIT52013.1 PAS domain S-box protein [candidate division Zixibacteria bacterium]
MKVVLRMIIVDDVPENIDLILSKLGHTAFDPQHKVVRSLKGLKSALENNLWDIVTCNYNNGKVDPLKVLQTTKSMDFEVPVIFIADEATEEEIVETIIEGARGFVTKNKISRLAPVVNRALRETAIRISAREAYKSLQESENRYRSIIENASQGIAIIQDGFLRYANPRLLEIAGANDGELVDEPFIKLIYDEDRSDFNHLYLDLLRGQEMDDHLDMRLKSTDKNVKWLRYNGVNINWNAKPAVLFFIKDITEQRIAEEKAKKSSKLIEHKSIALQEILGQIQEDKDSIKKSIYENIEQAVIPTLHRLKEIATPSQLKLFEVLEKDLRKIASPFIIDIEDDFSKLSPRELEVCRLIKNGMTSKEIAQALGISPMTVHKHRELIRRKLGLVNNGMNLNSYLKNKMEEQK